MDGSSKVAAAILGAAFFAVVGFVGYHEFDRHRDAEAAAAALAELDASSARLVSQMGAQQVAGVAQRRAESSYDLARRALSGNQRCVGGVVVQVDGTVYTQVGTISDPVHCLGGYADRALR